VPGTFSYAPAAGTVLSAGTQTITATFTPADTTIYSPTNATVNITVNKTIKVVQMVLPVKEGLMQAV